MPGMERKDMLRNDLLIRAAKGLEVDRTPVWVMRQAGRVLPEYRAVRNKLKGFKELVKNPELAAEVTLQPVDILGVDAAIIFSDILVIPEAMGLPYEMIESEGPVFPKTVRSQEELLSLHTVDPEEDLGYVLDAIRLVKKELNGRVPLIGFAGAPWTIFSYMVEGKGSKTYARSRRMLYQQPDLSHHLLTLITEATISYLRGQIVAGVDLVQLFDSWAGVLTPALYRTFGIPYIKQICESIKGVPITVFAKGAFFALEDLHNVPCHTVGLDWNISPHAARDLFGKDKTLQGNLDPAALYADVETIRKETREMLQRFGPQRHIANLGHGVYPDTNPDHLKAFIDTVKEFQF